MIQLKINNMDHKAILTVPADYERVVLALWTIGLDRDPEKYTLRQLDAEFTYTTEEESQMVRLIDPRSSLKGELRNVLVKLEADGVLDAQSVLVGTMAAGETKQAKLTFTPKLDSAGTHSGTVTITCEDAYGNAFSQTLDVTLTVDEPIPEVELQQEEEKEKMKPGTVALIILCVVMAAGLVAQGTILTKKIHKLEEERL